MLRTSVLLLRAVPRKTVPAKAAPKPSRRASTATTSPAAPISTRAKSVEAKRVRSSSTARKPAPPLSAVAVKKIKSATKVITTSTKRAVRRVERAATSKLRKVKKAVVKTVAKSAAKAMKAAANQQKAAKSQVKKSIMVPARRRRSPQGKSAASTTTAAGATSIAEPAPMNALDQTLQTPAAVEVFEALLDAVPAAADVVISTSAEAVPQVEREEHQLLSAVPSSDSASRVLRAALEAPQTAGSVDVVENNVSSLGAVALPMSPPPPLIASSATLMASETAAPTPAALPCVAATSPYVTRPLDTVRENDLWFL